MAASRRSNLNCFHFLMVFNAQEAFMGSTPERLWRRRGALLRTEALAGTVASHADDRQAQRLGNWLMADDKNQRENMLVVEDICQRMQGRPARWKSCRRRLSVCGKYSISGAVFGPSWRSLTMPAAFISSSPRRRLLVYRAGLRWILSPVMSFLPAAGMQAPPAICRWRKANFAFLCVRRKSNSVRSDSTPVRGSSAVPTRSRSGRKLKIKPRDCVRYCCQKYRENDAYQNGNSLLYLYLASIFDTGQIHVCKRI